MAATLRQTQEKIPTVPDDTHKTRTHRKTANNIHTARDTLPHRFLIICVELMKTEHLIVKKSRILAIMVDDSYKIAP